MPGGGWGKASICPEDAAGAHQLWKDADQQPTNGKAWVVIFLCLDFVFIGLDLIKTCCK